MKIPVHALLDLLEAEMTEARCDVVAGHVSKTVARIGGPVGKLFGGIVYGALDTATPEILFAALRKAFGSEHAVEVPQELLILDEA